MAKPSRLRLTVDVEGVAGAAGLVDGFARRAYQTTPLMAMIAQRLADISRERVTDAPWLPLTDGTVRRKASQGEDTGILRDEWRPIKGTPTRKGDALYLALTQDGAPGQIKRWTRTWAVFGVQSAGQGPLFYARFVQNVRGKKRRILAIRPEQAEELGMMVARWIAYGHGSIGTH